VVEQVRVDVQGVRVPPFLYGTAWKEDATAFLVGLALEAGFRGIDTANQRRHYLEAGVGDALAEALSRGNLKREDLFLQTKFTSVGGQDHRLPYDAAADPATQVRQSFHSSLEHLRVATIDSLLIHGPQARHTLAADDREIWRAMEELHGEGLVGLLGLSNVTARQVAELVDLAEVPPAFVQNRCYARLGWDREVRSVCAANGIVYQGFSLLTANVGELRGPVVQRIAARHERTPPQVIFRFAHQVGMICLSGTTDPTHMREDLAIFDFELSREEIDAIENVG
jgi:diketogulonate reductase-like aldo/keto reductase